MKKEELIKLAKELSEKDDLSSDNEDLLFLKKEYKRLNDREEESFYETQLTHEFNSYYEIIVKKVPALSRSSYEDKKVIIEKAKELLNKEGIKNLSKDLNELFNQFKHLDKCSKEQDDALWEEFKSIRIAINKKIDEHFENVKVEFEQRTKEKKNLIEEAKKILEIENIKEATTKMDALMEQWKKVGFAGKENDDNLWEEFSNIRKQFSAKRKEHFENMKKVFEERANKKEEIIKNVKKITSDAYFTDEEVKQIKDIQNEFKNIGFAGKEKDDDLWERFNAAIKQYFEEMKFYKF